MAWGQGRRDVSALNSFKCSFTFDQLKILNDAAILKKVETGRTWTRNETLRYLLMKYCRPAVESGMKKLAEAESKKAEGTQP